MSAFEPTASSAAASPPSSTGATVASSARSTTTEGTHNVSDGDISNTYRFAVGDIFIQRRGCRVAADNTYQDPPSITVRAVDGGGTFPNGTKYMFLDDPLGGGSLKRAGELTPWKTDGRIEQGFWIEDGEFVTVVFKFKREYSNDPFETTWERGYHLQAGTT